MNTRNIAIIAHVDHGKTTLVDCLLRQSGQFHHNEKVIDRVMDSNALEKERGITILSKCTSIDWKNLRINIVDTPGHADFGGEVERILNMVDGVMLLVDAAEGPMPQTKFVLTKALNQNLNPIVLINKVDRSDQRATEVLNDIFDLFIALDANDKQLDFPVLYSSAKNGWASNDPDKKGKDMEVLLEKIVDHIPSPEADPNGPLKMLVTSLERDPYLGRVLTGRINSGSIQTNQKVKSIDRTGKLVEKTRITKLLNFRGLERTAIKEAFAGDIIAIAGFELATVSNTICNENSNDPLDSNPIDPPTLVMTFSINDSPLSGTEGSKITSREIWDRLKQEAEGNISITINQTENPNAFEVAGRGELQLGILIETMRREGFELSVSRPRVLFKNDEKSGEKLEPLEEVTIDVDQDFTGIVVEKLSSRKGDMQQIKPSGGDKQRIIFLIPSRSLIGYHSEFMTDTRGTGLMTRSFQGYSSHKGSIPIKKRGVMISGVDGKSVAYALWNLEDRGPLFIGPNEKVYNGMIIGENTKGQDLTVNPLKGKQLTNIRAAGKDEAVDLTPPVKMDLDKYLAYINDDELVEITPSSIRLRKIHLDPHERKRAQRDN
tara:strand:- start:1487 stop:3301 length:1815 start_codon:yes stop_codon:yes gene_type:complete